MTEEKKKLLRNHIPTIIKLGGIFLECLNCPEDIDEDAEATYLLEILAKMAVQWQGAKDLLEE